MKIERAILSVSNKEGLPDLARRLHGAGIELISTGGTGKALTQEGIPYQPISDVTGFPEILDGRVKTLHPGVHAGILARRDLQDHLDALQELKIGLIDLVVVNLYPFIETVRKRPDSMEEAVENIDIGGPALIRAAAKNHESVTVVVDPADYPEVWAEMQANDGAIGRDTRLRLARKAFQHTAAYDAAIAAFLAERDRGPQLPASLTFSLQKVQDLRYGENPHQSAAFYRSAAAPASALSAARLLQGKELSFNNLLDLNAAWQLIQEFNHSACAIIKHTNPCGVAAADSLPEAYRKALSCDPVSAFGSIIAFNRALDAETAEALLGLFVEGIVAPAFDEAALEAFRSKKNLRILEMPEASPRGARDDFDLKTVSGGFLVQHPDRYFVREQDLKAVSRRAPEDDEVAELLFAWKVCKHVKSNAIVYCRDGQTIGIGAGQMSRVDSARIGAEKARSPLQASVMASDAFFPFRDAIDEAAKRGVRAVIQPGGSIRDAEIIDAIDEHDMAMVFTGIRHFRH
ncbi:MAG TPA: bifunctional phosphoribosylaminoimidazolecarboxamide formyltransferase/IMP cyclohydrolase [Acidobacteriota bacterium]|nr:bifunctional phosphoribosylaminoimidazolecarboxamide formyltransferase/IMP cyclohydrolase [Acidobacteriota bacterium]